MVGDLVSAADALHDGDRGPNLLRPPYFLDALAS
jgi:hypothetical protein